MGAAPGLVLLQGMAGVDPTPLFVLSLLPYLAFLRWAGRVRAFPRLALRGFQLTLLFVAVTIAAAIAAQVLVGRQLADVDPLHGGAESLLTLCNLLVVLGFAAATPPSRDEAPAGAVPPACSVAPQGGATREGETPPEP